MPNDPVEVTVIPDVVACELSRVELIGPLTRLVFTIPDRDDHYIVAKLILPTEAIPAVIQALGARPHSQTTTAGERFEVVHLRH